MADTARSTRDARLVLALVGEAVQGGFTTVDRLERELANGPRRGRAALAGAVQQVATGTHSAPEADLRRIVAATGLPEPEWNADLLVGGSWVARPDALWRAPCLALEADSREWHLSPVNWEHTMRRHNRMTAAGCTVLHFPPSRLAGDRREVGAEIVATYRRLEAQLHRDRETPVHRRRWSGVARS